ncbi:hypothetical protein UlMin_008797 [Ulmus minor]
MLPYHVGYHKWAAQVICSFPQLFTLDFFISFFPHFCSFIFLRCFKENWVYNILKFFYMYGMLACPLLELGQMEDAEKAVRKALEINEQDLWGQHNVSYSY